MGWIDTAVKKSLEIVTEQSVSGLYIITLDLRENDQSTPSQSLP